MELLRTMDAAKALGITYYMMNQWLNRKDDPVPWHQIGSTRWFDIKEVQAWMKKH